MLLYLCNFNVETRNLDTKMAYLSHAYQKSEDSCQELGIPLYNHGELRLFIDSSKRKLECVLHSGNLCESIPIGHFLTV